jgi:hypothetical protein
LDRETKVFKTCYLFFFTLFRRPLLQARPFAFLVLFWQAQTFCNMAFQALLRGPFGLSSSGSSSGE